MKIRIAMFLLSVVIVSCSKPGQFEINGTITNSMTNKIYLDRLEVNGTTPFDSSKIDKQGHFKIKGMVNQPTFFLLRLNDQNFITLLLDSNEQVNISADYLNFPIDYNLTGSPGSELVKRLNQRLYRTNNSLDSLQSLYRLNADINKRDVLLRQIEKVRYEQQAFSNQFILENPFSLASVLAIYQKFNNGDYIVQNLQTIKISASALYSMFPNSEHAKALYNDTKSMMATSQSMKLKELINSSGENSPEISLPDNQGREIKLSSLKGKYVLVHFWSAFDATSRIMNPVLKENYQKFKPKGFEIFQVSVDTSRQAWIQAINNDQLNWINVGDMKGSLQAVGNYNISSVPSNYLLDREGRILARDLKGPALYRKLSEILN